MSRRHRMTPARRAALRKAQLAAAKKRKRAQRIRTAKRTGATVAGLTGVAAVGVMGHRIRSSRSSTGPRALRDWEKQLGSSRTRGRQNTVPTRKGVFKQRNPKGYLKVAPPYYVKRNRPAYDARRRSLYAAGKDRR